jgi:hypothetical protein
MRRGCDAVPPKVGGDGVVVDVSVDAVVAVGQWPAVCRIESEWVEWIWKTY